MNKKPSALKRIIRGYKRQSVRARALIWTVILVVLLVLFPAFINFEVKRAHGPSSLYFTTTEASPGVGDSFAVELRVQTSGQAINAVQSHIFFNPLYLQVVNMTTDTSFCSFYTENTFDNIKGEVDIACGIPNPGFTGDSLVAHLNMQTKLPGDTSITVDPDYTQVLANDGKGTNILNGTFPHLDLTIQQLF